MKEACRTNLDIPSLIKKIKIQKKLIKKNCVKFRSIATDWGNEHKNTAKECYFSIFSSSHKNLTIRGSGLIINPNYPYIGASPDATVECNWCGISCLKIWCSYPQRGDSIPQMLGKKLYSYKCWRQSAVLVKPFLLSGPNGYWLLVLNCDFFVWTEKDTFLQTILVDTEIQADILSKTKPLFCDILLPDVVGKYFTNSTNSDKTKDSSMVPH